MESILLKLDEINNHLIILEKKVDNLIETVNLLEKKQDKLIIKEFFLLMEINLISLLHQNLS